MTNEELHWLAGWLEGEGSFYFIDVNNDNNKSPRVCVTGFSVDKDSIEKVAALMGASIYFHKAHVRKNTDYVCKGGWRAHLEGQKAVDLMTVLLPLMGKRRSEQIKAALIAWENRRNKPVAKLCACGCGRAVFGGPRVLYSKEPGAWCGQRAYRERRKAENAEVRA